MLETLDATINTSVLDQRTKINDMISKLNSGDIAFIIDLGVENPRVSGYEIDLYYIGKSTDDKYWIKLGENDTDWEEIFRSTDGHFTINFQLLDSSGLVIPDGIISTANGRVVVGDGVTINGLPLAYKDDYAQQEFNIPDGYIRFASIKNGGNISLEITTDTGNGLCYSINNEVPVHLSEGSVNIPAKTNGVPTIVYIWPASSSTSGKVGNFTVFRSLVDNSIYVYNLSKCVLSTELTLNYLNTVRSLRFKTGHYGTINLSGFTRPLETYNITADNINIS